MSVFELANDLDQIVQIKVIGVGGGGGNAVNRMVASGVQGAEFIAVNTDKQILGVSVATHKIQIGERTTGGVGTGGIPQVGMKSAEESREAITDALRGADMVFVTAGMGGGTGTGAAPIVAQISKDLGILTIGVVTKPFRFEGKHRMEQAMEGIARLAESVDSLIVIPNEHLKRLSDQKLPMKQAFALADQVLLEGVRNISELIKVPSYINLDFADVCTVMRGAGYAHLGVGYGKGEDKARAAAESAVCSPLLETSIDGARGLIINIRASEDVDLDEVESAVDYITKNADPNAHTIWGIALDEEMEDELSITVVATGFDPKRNLEEPRPEREPGSYKAFDLPPPIEAFFGTGPKPGRGAPQPASAPPGAAGAVSSGAAQAAKPGASFETLSLDEYPVSSPAGAGARNGSAAFTGVSANEEVDKDHDTVIGMLVDKLQRERGRRRTELD